VDADTTTPWSSQLAELRREWHSDDHEDWPTLVRRSTAMSVGAFVLTAVSGLEQLSDIDRAAVIDPHVADALQRFAPDLDHEVIAQFPVEALRGLESALRGALFEIVVADEARRGELDLPEGVSELRLADDFSTPGHDVVLRDDDGALLDVAQLKTSDSADLIVRHLDRYPEVDVVLASTEAAHDAVARGIPNIIDTGISNAELKTMVAEFIAAYSIDGVGDVVDGLVPEAAYIAIAVQFAWKVLRGTDPREAIGEAGVEAFLATALAVLATAGSVVAGTELVRIPVVVAFGAARLLVAEVDRSTYNIRLLGEAARSLAVTV